MEAKKFWISYDLGGSDDYSDLYYWLALNGTVECGNSVAYIKEYAYYSDFKTELISDLRKNAKITNNDRIYVIPIGNKGNSPSGFYIGDRKKSAPWQQQLDELSIK